MSFSAAYRRTAFFLSAFGSILAPFPARLVPSRYIWFPIRRSFGVFRPETPASRRHSSGAGLSRGRSMLSNFGVKVGPSLRAMQWGQLPIGRVIHRVPR